jgi:hypothetical protein
MYTVDFLNYPFPSLYKKRKNRTYNNYFFKILYATDPETERVVRQQEEQRGNIDDEGENITVPTLPARSVSNTKPLEMRDIQVVSDDEGDDEEEKVDDDRKGDHQILIRGHSIWAKSTPSKKKNKVKYILFLYM